jgi:hypothetical protein
MLGIRRFLLIVLLLTDFLFSGNSGTAGYESEVELAVTVDDLPRMGTLPAGESRIEIARQMIRTLKANGISSYGFANGA